MKADGKRIELLLLMDKAGLINVPERVSEKTMKKIVNHGLTDKTKLTETIIDRKNHYPVTPNPLNKFGTGPVTIAEMCWWVVYGECVIVRQRVKT